MSDPHDGGTPQQPAAPPPADQPAATQPPPAAHPAPAGQPAGQPGSSGDGLDPKIASLLAYVFTIVGGLVIYFTQKDPRARFHGAQAILFGIAWFALWVAFTILGIILSTVSGVLATLFSLLGFVVGIGFLVLWVMLCIKGYGLEHFKLPVIGDMAESWANK